MNKKQRIVHGQGASNINYSTIVFKLMFAGFPNESLLLTTMDLDHIINSRGEKIDWHMLCWELCEISLTVLLVNCHDVTSRIFDQWISRQTTRKKNNKGLLESLRPSLRQRRNLTSVCTVCEAAPLVLLQIPNGLNELPEVNFEFPFNLSGKSTIPIVAAESRCVLKSWYTVGRPEQGFRPWIPALFRRRT